MGAALGHAPEHIEPGRMHRFATSGRPGDTAGWCKLFPDLAAGVYGCHRQGVSQTWVAGGTASLTHAQLAELTRMKQAAAIARLAEQRQQWDTNAKRNAELWAQCEPLAAHDPCVRYLKARGIADVWPLPGVLRFHRALPYWQGNLRQGTFPALVAPLIDPHGRMLALHRTYLLEAGSKAPVPTPKKLTAAAGPLPGACIPLHQPERGCIGIAEGIETALAAWCASSLPTVAAYCGASLAAWQWPPNVQRIVVFADADQAGREAADTLRARVLRAGLRVDVLAPSQPGADWCDVWASRGAVEASA